VEEVYGLVRQTETIFDAPQDVEWTIKEGKLYALQSRPITTAPNKDANERRAFDLGLRRSFANLKALGERIENELIPALVAEADTFSRKDLRTSSDAELAEEIACRKSVIEKWQGIYWNDFIPFAHGVRLFGQTYNDRLTPSDPYEFVDLLVASGMKSTERNAMLAQLAHKVKENPSLLHEHAEGRGEGFMRELDEFIERFSGHSCTLTQCTDQRSSLIKLLQEFSEPSEVPKVRAPKDTEQLGQRYLQAFAPDEQPYAQELLELAKKSYRLRDDDNIYLGRLEAQLVAATEESRRRLGARCKDEYACTNPEEIIRALKFSQYVPSAPDSKPKTLPEAALTARQLRGQPAGAGIGRGRARIIITVSDLFEVKRGEILVCDAIDPNMTFVIPLVAGIVERRGGMLIHGAIIAREYGLPCVTGIPDATRFINTGDQVIVDGYYGLVIIEKQVNERAAGKAA
jgi:pyruvate,water dikinase